MKKLLLVSAILIGAATASQAGVHFRLGLPLPVPVPVYSTPYCAPAYDYAPRVVVDPYYSYGYGYGCYPNRSYYYPNRYYSGRYYGGGHYRGGYYGGHSSRGHHGRW